MDLEGRANFWNPFAAGPLQLVLTRRSTMDINLYKRLILLISLAICCIVSISVLRQRNAEWRSKLTQSLPDVAH